MPTINTKGTLKTLLDGDEVLPVQDVGGSPEDLKATIDQLIAQLYPPTMSGAYHLSTFVVPTATNQTLVVGTYYGVLFSARPGCTFDNIAVEVNTTGPAADGNFRVGIYEHDHTTKLPKANLIFGSAAIAYTVAGMAPSTTAKTIALGSSVTVPKSGLFWVVLQSDTAMALRTSTGNYQHNHFKMTSGVNILNSGGQPFKGISVAGAFGAMPTTPPTMTYTGSVPIIALYKT
jgi:hypothetical protein